MTSVFKRGSAFVLALLILMTVLPLSLTFTGVAATPDTVYTAKSLYGKYTCPLEYASEVKTNSSGAITKVTWAGLNAVRYTTGSGLFAYCLQHRRPGPESASTGINYDGKDFESAFAPAGANKNPAYTWDQIKKGIMAIMSFGYPSRQNLIGAAPDNKGIMRGFTFTQDESYYITQNALRFWIAETVRNYESISFIGEDQSYTAAHPEAKPRVNDSYSDQTRAQAMLNTINDMVTYAKSQAMRVPELTVTVTSPLSQFNKNLYRAKLTVSTDALRWEINEVNTTSLYKHGVSISPAQGVTGETEVTVSIQASLMTAANMPFNIDFLTYTQELENEFRVFDPGRSDQQVLLNAKLLENPNTNRNIQLSATIQGSAKFVKLDSKTHTGTSSIGSDLSAARFAIYAYPSATVVKENIAPGEVVSIDPGNYVWRETVSPNGYVPDTSNHPFTVADGEAKVIDVENTPIMRDFELIKYKTDVNDSDASKTPEQGAKFEIRFASDNSVFIDNIITDADGKYEIAGGLPFGSYILHQVSGDPDHLLAEDVSFTVDDNSPNKLSFEIRNKRKKDQTGKITIIKLDGVTHSATPVGECSLEGAKFSIYANGPIVSDPSIQVGQLLLENVSPGNLFELYPGDYYALETVPGVGYVLNTEPQYFTVTANGNDAVRVENQPKYGIISVLKTSDDNIPGVAPVPEEGAIFEVYDNAGNLVGTITTNSNGYGELSTPVPYGHYRIHQVAGRQHYAFASDKNILVDGDTAESFTNILTVATIQITKKDANTHAVIKAAGAEFTLTSVDDPARVYTANTDTNGVAMFEAIPFGDYELREITAPAGYLLNTAVKPLSLVSGTHSITIPLEADFEDTPQQGYIEILKKGLQLSYIEESDVEYGKLYTQKFEQEYLQGAVFGIYADGDVTVNGAIVYHDGELVASVTTGNGPTRSSALPLGSYKVKESSAPAGFVISAQEYPVTLAYDNTAESVVVEVNAGNDKVPVVGSLMKTARYAVTVTNNDVVYTDFADKAGEGFVFGLFAKEAITALDGSSIPVDGLVAYGATDAYGEFAFGDVKPGKYYIKELKALDGYQLLTTKYDVDFSVNPGDTVAYVDLGEIVNVEKTFSHKITKYGVSTNQKLAGAEFEVYNSENKLVAKGTTDEKGEFSFVLKPGVYTYKETKAPEGYVLNSGLYTFTIESDGTSTETSVYDEYARFILKKTDEAGNPLQNVTFGLFNADTDAKISEATTGADGLAVFEPLMHGSYYVKEIRAADGYILKDTKYSFTVNGSWRNKAAAEYNETVTNQPNQVVLSKTDLTSAAPVPGATIIVTDSVGNEYFRGVTNSDGQIILNKLPAGDYKFKEVSAPAGYALNVAEFTFHIDEYGTVTGNTAITDEPNKIRIRKVDTAGNGLANVTFGLYKDNAKVEEKVTDANGYAEFKQLPFGDYTIKEEAPLAGYAKIDTTYSFTINGNWVNSADVACEFTNQENKVELSKLGPNGEAVPGVTIAVSNSTGVYYTGTTNSEGKIVFSKIPAGNYTFKEIASVGGYALNPTEYSFSVSEYGVVSGTVTMTDEFTSIRIRKVDENNAGLSGVVFGLYKDGAKVGEQTTNGDGIATFTQFAFGKYTVKEEQAPEGYAKTDAYYEFTADAGWQNSADIAYTFVNSSITVELSKKDGSTGRFVPGATFNVYKSDDTLFATGVTNNEGKIVLEHVPVGSYYFIETGAPEGYALNDVKNEFAVDQYGNVTGTTHVSNELNIVRIRKVDGEDNGLANVRFGLYKDGSKVEEKATDSNGYAVFTGLAFGNYAIKEEAPCPGYGKTDYTYEFSVTATWKNADNNGVLARFVNAPNVVTLYKRDSATSDVLANATFEIKDASGAVYATATTGIDGKIVLNKIPAGNYTFRETAAPSGYELNDQVYSFSVDDYGTVTGTLEISNKINKIAVLKVDENNAPLAGAEFGLYSNGNLVENKRSGDDGIVEFSNMAPGQYTIKEIRQPAGYVLVKDEFNFTVTAQYKNPAEPYQFTFVNLKTVVIIDKVNEDDEALAGAEFAIERSNSDFKELHTTDENGQIILTGYVPGEYTYYETSAPEGYALNTARFTFNIAEDGTLTKVPEKVVNKKNIFTMLKISVDQRPLANAEFNLEGNNGTVLTAVSDENGMITFSGMPYGEYTLRETKPTPGFHTAEFEFRNDPQYAPEEIKITVNGTYLNEDHPYGTIINYENVAKLRKVRDDDPEQAIAGAKFIVTDNLGTVVFEGSTDENGEIVLTQIVPGIYSVQETEPAPGYVLDPTIHNFAVSDDGEVTGELVYTNRETEVILKKVEYPSDTPVAGAEIQIISEAGEAVYTGVTDANGEIRVNGLVPGKYTYRETKAPNGYALNTAEFSFELGTDGQLKAEPEAIQDVPAFAAVRKVDSNGEPLEGVKFGLFSDTGIQLAEAVTNEEGIAVFDRLLVGTYLIRETEALEGYQLSEETLTINVDEFYINPAEYPGVVNEEIPKSGYAPNLSWLIALIILAAVILVSGAIGFAVIRKRVRASR